MPQLRYFVNESLFPLCRGSGSVLVVNVPEMGVRQSLAAIKQVWPTADVNLRCASAIVPKQDN